MDSKRYYLKTKRPSWAPPSWLFGPVWSVLYILIFISFGYVFYKGYIGDIPLKVANINKDKFNLTNVNFYKGDLFDGVKGLGLENKTHIIASNPPYIPREDIKGLQIEVKDFEPMLALDGGLDGLDFYRRITKNSKGYLVNGGLLIYEIGYDQGEAVRNILIQEGFGDIHILKDLQGHDRVVLGTFK